jgi:hypothetical protein
VGVVNPMQALEVAGNAVFGGNISAGNLGMFRNRIINGDMRIDQRNSGTGVTLSGNPDRKYGVDNWRGEIYNSTGAFRLTQVSDAPPGYIYSLNCAVTTGFTFSGSSLAVPLRTGIEGIYLVDIGFGTINAIPLILSFWVKSNVIGTHSVCIRGLGGNLTSFCAAFIISNINMWEYKTISISPDSSSTIWNYTNILSMDIAFCGYSASGFNATIDQMNKWVKGANIQVGYNAVNPWGTINNYVSITGVQLEKGTLATPFEFRPYPIELQLCQRYYYIAYVLFKQYIAASGFGHMVYPLPTPFRTRTGATITFNIILGSSVTAGDNGIDTLNVHLFGQNTAGGAVTIGANGYLIIISEL